MPEEATIQQKWDTVDPWDVFYSVAAVVRDPRRLEIPFHSITEYKGKELRALYDLHVRFGKDLVYLSLYSGPKNLFHMIGTVFFPYWVFDFLCLWRRYALGDYSGSLVVDLRDLPPTPATDLRVDILRGDSRVGYFYIRNPEVFQIVVRILHDLYIGKEI